MSEIPASISPEAFDSMVATYRQLEAIAPLVLELHARVEGAGEGPPLWPSASRAHDFGVRVWLEVDVDAELSTVSFRWTDQGEHLFDAELTRADLTDLDGYAFRMGQKAAEAALAAAAKREAALQVAANRAEAEQRQADLAAADLLRRYQRYVEACEDENLESLPPDAWVVAGRPEGPLG